MRKKMFSLNNHKDTMNYGFCQSLYRRDIFFGLQQSRQSLRSYYHLSPLKQILKLIYPSTRPSKKYSE